MRMFPSTSVLTVYFVFGFGTVSGTTDENPSAHEGSVICRRFESKLTQLL